MRRGIFVGGLFSGATVGLLLAAARGHSAEALSNTTRSTAEAVHQVIAKKAGSEQWVVFPETGWSPVKVVRGNASTTTDNAPKTAAEKSETAEIVTFEDPQHISVRVLRGEADRAAIAAEQPRHAGPARMETVSFADPRDRPVSILRGAGSHMADIELFGGASVTDLERVAFAVDGAESSHGADLRMWRSEPSGPQGPMQITAAAATDVGGGDRFDLVENRVLGRAYLAQLYRRYGNWPDTIAAYNWGPGNLDAWISVGRPTWGLPLGVERYRDRILRDAALAGPSAIMRAH
jgi:Transglycosylase SLT domain